MEKIIDAHIHMEKTDGWMYDMSKTSKVDTSLNGLKKEMKENSVVAVIALGLKSKGNTLDKEAETPIIPEFNDASIIRVGGINPHKPNVELTEKAIKEGKIKGLKIYLGYYHFYPNDKVYEPFYHLAEKYNIPVIFHTGDTYSDDALIKISHPLNIDEVAIKFRKVNFIIAHFGNPWLADTGELIWKNKNVYADLSGLMIGKLDKLRGVDVNGLKAALQFSEHENHSAYDKVLYGSDWPLVPMKPYINFIKGIIPKEHQKKVFFENANRLFNLGLS